MRLLIDIKDSKAGFVMELLQNFSFIKEITPLNNNTNLVKEVEQAVKEINLVKKGKLKARPAKELLNEL